MITSFARVRTEHAREHLAFLIALSGRSNLRHANDDMRALVQLQTGYCEFAVGDGFLDVSITASSISDAVALEDVVSDRLDDAAQGEELHYQWIMTPESSRAVPSATRPIRAGLL